MLDQYVPTDDPHFSIDQTVFGIGTRGSGKTTAAAAILLELRKYYPVIFVFTKTAQNNFWQQFVPANRVFSTLEKLPKLIDAQKQRYAEWQQARAESSRNARGNPNVLVVFEDFVSEASLRKCPGLEEICFNGRHFGIVPWILSQAAIGLTPNQRENIDRFFIWEPRTRTQQFIRDAWGIEAKRLIETVATGHRCVVINNRTGVPREKKFMAWETDVDLLKSRWAKHMTLGNARFWGEIDIEEQKREYPYKWKAMDAKKLVQRFEEPVVALDEDNTLSWARGKKRKLVDEQAPADEVEQLNNEDEESEEGSGEGPDEPWTAPSSWADVSTKWARLPF